MQNAKLRGRKFDMRLRRSIFAYGDRYAACGGVSKPPPYE